jgi:hypothetical protein
MRFRQFVENTSLDVWLDDERDPRDQYIQQHFGAKGNEVWVRTAQEAIKLLSTGNVISISLDHDLGPGSGPGSGDGMEVAKWIEENAFLGTLPALQWSIHSQNPVGRDNMLMAMKNADRYWHGSEAQE